MDMNSVVILMLISFIIGMVMGISLVRPGRSVCGGHGAFATTTPLGLSAFLSLPVPQPAHLFARRQQIVQRAFSLDPAILQHDDVISPAQRGAAMRGDKQG